MIHSEGTGSAKESKNLVDVGVSGSRLIAFLCPVGGQGVDR